MRDHVTSDFASLLERLAFTFATATVPGTEEALAKDTLYHAGGLGHLINMIVLNVFLKLLLVLEYSPA